MKANSEGFTIVELMIVIAIIAVLASVAFSEYRQYVIRTKLTEGVELAGGFKPSVVEWISSEGRCPAHSDSAYLGAGEAHGQYVSGISFSGTLGASGGCTVTANFKSDDIDAALSGRHLSLLLTSTGSAAVWECRSNVDIRYLPKNCTAE